MHGYDQVESVGAADEPIHDEGPIAKYIRDYREPVTQAATDSPYLRGQEPLMLESLFNQAHSRWSNDVFSRAFYAYMKSEHDKLVAENASKILSSDDESDVAIHNYNAGRIEGMRLALAHFPNLQ